MSKYDFNFLPIDVVRLCPVQMKKTTGSQWEIICPYTPKTIHLNITQGVWKCFHQCSNCPVNSGGILDFYRLYYNCEDNKHALLEIGKALNSDSFKRTKREVKAEMKKYETQEEHIASNDALDTAYRAFLQELPLKKEHFSCLIKRGFSAKDILAMQFRSIPQKEDFPEIIKKLKKKNINLDFVSGFYMQNNEYTINIDGSGFFIPHYDIQGKIVALQIRRDLEISEDLSHEMKKELKSQRYRWFSSKGLNKGAKAKNVPFYGIPKRKHKKDVVYLTEGGLKAACSQSLSDGWFVSISGVTAYSSLRTLLENLKKAEVKVIVDAFDSDRYSNESVFNSIQKIKEIVKEYGFVLKDWDFGTEHKGVDDYLLAQKKQKKALSKSLFFYYIDMI